MGMDRGTTYHDYDVDTNLGMVSFHIGNWMRGRGILAYEKRTEVSWGIGYVELLYNPGILDKRSA